MDSLVSKISDSELEVLRVLWSAKCALPLVEIRSTLEKTSDWETSTIKTLLRRLCSKGVVTVDKKEVFYYKPVVTEEEYNQYATQNLINKLYAGSAKNLVASLVDNNKLGQKDIEELRNLFKVGGKDE